VQPHRHHGEGIAHALAGISQDLGHRVIPFEARITVFDADPLLGERTIVLFLLCGEFAFWLSFLGRFALRRRGHHSLSNLQALKATISLEWDGRLAREFHLIEDLLIMLCPWCLRAYGQDALGLRMRDRHMLVGVTLFLPRVGGLLFLLVLWATDRPLRAVGEYPQFFEFGVLLNDFFQ